MKNQCNIALMISLILFSGIILAQNQPVTSDSTQEKPESVPEETEEIILDTPIEIRGRVEKPGVIILPKRVTPEIQAVELDRSFEKEVKNGVGDIPHGEASLRKLEPVKSIKKAVEKKR